MVADTKAESAEVAGYGMGVVVHWLQSESGGLIVGAVVNATG